MRVDNQHYLVVTALGSNRFDILEIFTKITKQCGCNITESKLSIFGEECALLFYIAGTWNTIAKLEASLPLLAQQYHFTLQTKRTLPTPASNAYPYQIQVIAQDRIGILNELATFFTQHQIMIEKMECENYIAKNQAKMVNITFLIHIPAKQHLATFRDQFILYCEDRNLDIMIEPAK